MVGARHLWVMIASLFIPIFLTVPFAYSGASDSGFQPFDLGEVVVSADREREKNIAITNEITADDIKATNSHTVAEALSRAPGVRVTTGAKNQATVSIHGFDQSQILFMIDGVPYYETKFGILDLNSISTDNIARIEIIKGAPSVLYGANTMGGVVNIITKKPTEKPFTSASFEVSGNDTYRASASHGMKVGMFHYWLNYMYEKSGGWDLSDDYPVKEGTLTDFHEFPYNKTTSAKVFEDGGKRYNSDYETQNLSGRFGIEPNKDSQYYMTLFYRTKEKGVPSNTEGNQVWARPVFSQFYASYIPDYDEWGVDLDGRQRLSDKLVLKGKLFYHRHKDSLYAYEDPSLDDVLAKSHYKDYLAGGSLIVDFQPVSWDSVRLGLSYRGDSHKEVADEYLPYEKYRSYTGSIGLENEFTLIKNLTVVAGLSYDWYEVTEAKRNVTSTETATYGDYLGQEDLYQPNDDDINYMIGANYLFSDNTKIYASAARKSRFPTLRSLYNKLDANWGDPHLKSEKSNNYTIGASRPFGSFMRADFALFWHDIKDKISSTGSAKTGDYHPINIDGVRTIGYEAGVELYPVDKLILRADYTYTYAKDRSEDRVSDDVTGIPRRAFNLSAQYTLPSVNTKMDFNGSYVSHVWTNVTPGQEDSLDSYWLWNAKVTQPMGKHVEFYVAANNLFDNYYEWGDGYPAQGRSFWSGVSVKF